MNDLDLIFSYKNFALEFLIKIFLSRELIFFINFFLLILAFIRIGLDFKIFLFLHKSFYF